MIDQRIRRKTTIPVLLKRIRRLTRVRKADIDEVNQISDSVHDEWIKSKRRFKRKLMKSKLFNSRQYDAQESEEEIFFGMMDLLNRQITANLK